MDGNHRLHVNWIPMLHQELNRHSVPHLPPPSHPSAYDYRYAPQATPRGPLELIASSNPVYVNAKQYARILKRREARALLEAKSSKSSTTKKSYKHESRHKHACRRPRGPGGRFLTKEDREQLVERSEEDVTTPREFTSSSSIDTPREHDPSSPTDTTQDILSEDPVHSSDGMIVSQAQL